MSGDPLNWERAQTSLAVPLEDDETASPGGIVLARGDHLTVGVGEGRS
jgi:hypothetical protein